MWSKKLYDNAAQPSAELGSRAPPQTAVEYLIGGMKKPSRKILVPLLVIVLLVGILGGAFWLAPKGAPAISVTYIGVIDGKGHWRLRFGITNNGNSTVLTSAVGKIEVFNHTNVLEVAATTPMSQLAPGQGHVVDAVLSEAQMKSVDGKWRYTCLSASTGFRSRIYQWQWGPGGPGARVNWLVPQKLKGMPLTVKGTGDWIEPAK